MTSFYEQVGGHETFKNIVDTFYAGIADDDLLRPLYPEEDLGPAAERLTMFFEQYWGGPTTYSDQRGHPRLRIRHAGFAVTPAARDRWLTHFRAGLDAAALAPELDAQFWIYAQQAADFLVNSADVTD